jgi:uncharacterized protein YdhG (YjbR/CyaY superfamily)
MSAKDVDTYLESLPERSRSSLQRLREQLLELVPNAEESISYAMPCIKLSGKAVAGYAGFKNHLGYFPHSGNIVPQLAQELAGRKQTPGGFQFGIDEVLDLGLVERLVNLRLKELSEKYPNLEFKVTK